MNETVLVSVVPATTGTGEGTVAFGAGVQMVTLGETLFKVQGAVPAAVR